LAAVLATSADTRSAAQSERATITGTVRTPPSGRPRCKGDTPEPQTGVSFSIPTNASGNYTVHSCGRVYSVKVEKEGFRPATVSGIVLNARPTRADAGSRLARQHRLSRSPPMRFPSRRKTLKTSVTVDNKLVDELPLVVGGTMRSPFNLASLTPEAKDIGGVSGFVLGATGSGYGTSLDGVTANTTRALQSDWVAVQLFSIEAVTEFTVDTNGFKAEFGQASGGVMTLPQVRTNDFHGSGRFVHQ
jgi:hypothetical protein